MPRQSSTIRFILENTIRDRGGKSPQRLCFPYIREKFGVRYKDVVQLIAADSGTFDYFLDTNFITSH